MQGCGKGCDTRNEHEVDLNQLPPMPALDDISPEFHGMPDYPLHSMHTCLHYDVVTRVLMGIDINL